LSLSSSLFCLRTVQARKLEEQHTKKSFVKATENGIYVQVFLAAGVINVWHFG